MKTIMLLGFNSSTRAVYRYLKEKRVRLLIYEDNPQDADHDYWSWERLKREMPSIDIAIRSPGIKITSPVYELISVLAKEVMSEIDFAYLALRKKHIHYLIVSGTNGKTTAVNMIQAALKTIFSHVYLTGNVGIPLASYLDHIEKEAYVVLELSSFQLENTRYLKADYAYLTNIYPNHLDAVRNYEGYVASKMRLSYLVKNNHLLFFHDEVPSFIHGQDLDHLAKKRSLHLNPDDFQGLHNYRHALAALVIVSLYHEDVKKALLAIKSMKALPYRMEKVMMNCPLTIINDSKSTNVASTNQCLRTFHDRRRILIMGGHAKSDDFTHLELREDDLLYVYGEAGPQIAMIFPQAHLYDDLAQIIFIIRQYQNQEWYLLFSPGCSSFDQFHSYQERGAYFNKLIKENNYE